MATAGSVEGIASRGGEEARLGAQLVKMEGRGGAGGWHARGADRRAERAGGIAEKEARHELDA